MKLLLGGLCVLLMAGIVRADVVIVEKIDGMAQSGNMTITVGADKVRTDLNPQISTITDSTTGDITTLMHAQKAYMVMTAAMTQALVGQNLKDLSPQSGAGPASPTATGKTEKINGYDASEYTFAKGNIKATYWMATGYPNAKEVADALSKIRKGALADMTNAFAPDISGIPGVPIRTEVELNGGKITTELVSVKDQPTDPSEYQVPAGYSEVKMPSMPMAPQTPPAQQ